MITTDQLVLHAVGDYLIQNDWMANEKTRNSSAAAIHAVSYSVPFLLLRPSIIAFAVIVATHFLIDRFRLARYVCWLKNGQPRPLTSTGFPEGRPAWMSTWLLIIVDNLLHVLINGAALRWL